MVLLSLSLSPPQQEWTRIARVFIASTNLELSSWVLCPHLTSPLEYVLTWPHIQVYIMYELLRRRSRRQQPLGPTYSLKWVGDGTKPIPAHNQPIHNVQLGRELNPFQHVTIPLQNVQLGREPNPFQYVTIPLQNVQWEEGTKPNPFQCITNLSQCITNLSRMFNGRKEPNPFQYITNLSRMFNGRREPNPFQ